MNTFASPTPLRVAIVGSGPAGLFAADDLLRRRPGTQIDLLERLPLPFGLVRYGVAPDHPHTRRVMKMLEATLAKPGVKLRTGVEVGRDVTIEELRAEYDTVILATGAELDRPLGIPGEDRANVVPSTAFLGWVNGDPDFATLQPDLSVESAVIVGNGNVALDAARLLARPQDLLATTDMNPAALATFAKRGIRQIHVIGRRGPAQASFGSQEIAEFQQLTGWSVSVNTPTWDGDTTDDRVREVVETLRAFDGFPPRPPPHIVFHFCRRPVEVSATTLRVEHMALRDGAAVGTGVFEEIPCGLLVKAIGHRGQALPGVPFDAERDIVPNRAGRVLENGVPVPGLYCVGWIKRGAKGLIGHNRRCAMETVGAMMEDAGGVVR